MKTWVNAPQMSGWWKNLNLGGSFGNSEFASKGEEMTVTDWLFWLLILLFFDLSGLIGIWILLHVFIW